MSTIKSAWISTYSKLSFIKLDQGGTLERSFFNFLNSYATGKTTDKLKKTTKNGILISNSLFITIETNKK